eukprot:2098096-Prymnesium_polylepis.1
MTRGARGPCARRKLLRCTRGHAEGSSRGAYVRGGGHDVDVGAISMGRKASVVHDEGYAAWRVP